MCDTLGASQRPFHGTQFEVKWEGCKRTKQELQVWEGPCLCRMACFQRRNTNVTVQKLQAYDKSVHSGNNAGPTRREQPAKVCLEECCSVVVSLARWVDHDLEASYTCS